MFNDIEWMERKLRKMYFKFRTSQAVREEMLTRTLNSPWPWRRKEMVRNSQVSHLKENGISPPHIWWNDSKKRVTSTQEHRCFVSWNSEKKNRDIMHFSADAPNTELLFCTFHSANQLSIYGAVPSWCEEFGQRPNEKEPTSGKVRGKRKCATAEECETARSEFFGANSKE